MFPVASLSTLFLEPACDFAMACAVSMGTIGIGPAVASGSVKAFAHAGLVGGLERVLGA